MLAWHIILVLPNEPSPLVITTLCHARHKRTLDQTNGTLASMVEAETLKCLPTGAFPIWMIKIQLP